jgi:hypothetical protein
MILDSSSQADGQDPKSTDILYNRLGITTLGGSHAIGFESEIGMCPKILLRRHILRLENKGRQGKS